MCTDRCWGCLILDARKGVSDGAALDMTDEHLMVATLLSVRGANMCGVQSHYEFLCGNHRRRRTEVSVRSPGHGEHLIAQRRDRDTIGLGRAKRAKSPAKQNENFQ